MYYLAAKTRDISCFVCVLPHRKTYEKRRILFDDGATKTGTSCVLFGKKLKRDWKPVEVTRPPTPVLAVAGFYIFKIS